MKRAPFVLSAVLAAWLATPTFADEVKKPTRVPMPTVKINLEKGDKCVEPVEIMRRDHMKLILHQRDETLHKGIRTKQHSLKNCINCHADPKTNSVLGKDGFCENCHAYAAVSIDCFSCHTPDAEKETKAQDDTDMQNDVLLDRLVRLAPAPEAGAPQAGDTP